MTSQPLDAKTARALVSSIAGRLGYIEEQDWDTLSSDVRERMEGAVKNLKDLVASSVATLAKNLYTSNARFVFELLQNADDNHFERAKALGQTPYVSFKVYHNRIVIECNEDGFTEENLRAMCAVGKSSKTGAQGYIGEKGIGFKSVFMAAWKVHIQSNALTFSFIHRTGDTGLGMITPVWEDSTERLPEPVTRMTLSLHDTGGSEILSSQRETIRKQFNDLQESLLLFMKNLGEIRIAFYDEDERPQSSTTFSSETLEGSRVRLTRKSRQGRGQLATSKLYYMVKQRVNKLAKNENRTYSESEKQTKAYGAADITLAFPMSPQSKPIIEPQDVFAFLPIRHVGFSFLIQSDFVTQANRQDIVTTSQRNLDILSGIADTFREATYQLCSHESLQYTWMRYLPDDTIRHYDDFWQQLINKIRENLKRSPILRPWSQRGFRKPMDLRHLRQCDLDHESNPLLESTDPEIYLSSKYRRQDVKTLQLYGMPKMKDSDIVSLLKADCSRLDSRIRSRNSDKDWQHRISKLLVQILEATDQPSIRSSILTLDIIPLTDGSWVSGLYEVVYFSKCTNVPRRIPTQIGLRILDTVAEKDPENVKLMGLLGVEVASADFVCDRIFNCHSSKKSRLIKSWVNEAKFVYSAKCVMSTPELAKQKLKLINHNHHICRQSSTIYFPSNDKYGAKRMFGAQSSTTENHEPAFDILFLHSLYVEDPPEQPDVLSSSWEDWLCEFFGVRRRIHLITQTEPKQLSEAVSYVAQHRSVDFLGFLQYNWEEGGKEIEESQHLRDLLAQTKVPCQRGATWALGKTTFPIPELLEYYDEAVPGATGSPFLSLPSPITSENWRRDWGFLIPLGVQHKIDISFCLQVLDCMYEYISTLIPNENTAALNEQQVVKVYKDIYSMYIVSRSKECEKQRLRDFFKGERIFIKENSDADDWGWACAEQCFWDGPEFLASKPVLKPMYEKLTRGDADADASIRWLFREIVGMSDAQWPDMIEELEERQTGEIEDVDGTLKIYKWFKDTAKAMPKEEKERMKTVFCEKALIFCPNGHEKSWYKSTDCLWSSATEIWGKAILEEHYRGMRGFFVRVLNVETLSLGMVYSELKRLGSADNSSVAQVKEKIHVLNGFLAVRSDAKGLNKAICETKMFPVRHPDGHVDLCSIGTDFVIADRQHLGEHFQGKTKFLDFSFEQVHELGAFIRWIGITGRNISGLVKEVTRVEDSGKRSIPMKECRIRPQAHALCRIADHYKSPKLNGLSLEKLLERLRGAHVCKTDSIFSELHLKQDNNVAVHVLDKGDVHIRESDSDLEIFVPSNKRQREACYATKLPSHLLRWLMTDEDADTDTDTKLSLDEKARLIVSNLVNSKHAYARRILEEEGIKDITLEDDYEDEEDEEEDDGDDANDGRDAEQLFNQATLADVRQNRPFTPDLSQTASGSSSIIEMAPSTTATQESSEERVYASARHRYAALNRPAVISLPLPGQSDGIARGNVRGNVGHEGTDMDTITYRQLLGKVISAARRSSFPLRSGSSMDMSGLLGALIDDGLDGINSLGAREPLRFRSKTQMERDMMVGAAGELYVFELLKRLNPALPGFSMQNWQSTIRDYVKVHDEYRDIARWTGHREIADLMYEDVSGVLTQLLIEQGYLDETWVGCRPSYLLEVKTTTGVCSTPFFMSGQQYRRMRIHRDSRESVYIVFRVYQLNDDSIGMRVYVNPAKLEDDGQLTFTGESWSVTPGDRER